MFRKASLTYRPPQIEEYLQGLRARQQAAEQATEQNAAPENIASDTPSTPTPMPVPSTGAARTATKDVAPEAPTRPAGVTAEDRERAYRIRPGLRQRMEREGLTEDLVRTVLREGAAERVNDWTIRFRHDDYRVDVNTASAELITVVDEYEAECNDGANTTLARGEYTPLNALEMAFSERARVFLSKNPEFVFDIMVRTLENPESVRMGEGWTRIYAAEGLEMTISPDQRTVLSLTKTPDFQALHGESLRRAQIEDLSDAINRQAEAATSEQPKHQNAQNAEEEK
jgi:ATPase involved in DNA repair